MKQEQEQTKKIVNKADEYFLRTISEIEENGCWDENPRPKWSDGTPAFSKFITQQTFNYRIDLGELPIVTLRPTAIKGGFYDIEAIYIKQTNIVSEMNKAIHSWWLPFIVSDGNIGETYGATVKNFGLVDKLLQGMEKTPFGRRHILNLWQESQMEKDKKALVPCAFLTQYSISRNFYGEYIVDMSLAQRSQDYIMTNSINPIQYTQLGMMICGHLTHKTGIKHKLKKFQHNVQNVHIYDRHFWAVNELKLIQPSEEKIKITLDVDKNFYDYTIDDFTIEIPMEIPKLSKPLEIAV